MEKQKIVKMFDDLCCSNCHSSFDENSFEIIRQEDGLCVVQIVCSECKKSFGFAFLGLNSLDTKELTNKKHSDDDLKFKLDEELQPISYDDVLDAHKYIQDIDKNWKKFIEEKNL